MVDSYDLPPVKTTDDIYIRKSMLEDWYFCPYKFYLNYTGHKLPMNYMYAVRMGTRFHDWAEELVNRARAYNIDEWDDWIHPDYAPFEREMMEWFIHVERERIRKIGFKMWKPLFTEITLRDDDNRLIGTIDRVDAWDDKSVALVEYKTSKKVDDNSLKRQFAFYKIMMENVHGLEVARGILINPRLQVVKIYKISDYMVKKIKDDLRRLRIFMKQGETAFPKKCSTVKRIVCRACTYDDINEPVYDETIDYKQLKPWSD